MNRIGFTLLFLGTLLFLNTSCQNFFWSHRCCDTVVPPDTASTTYGYLYNWYAAIGDTEGNDFTSDTDIANEGWHTPSQTEWDALISYIGGSATGGGALKAVGTTYWNNLGGLDTYGFDARGGGQRINGYNNFKDIGTWWTSTLVSVPFKTARFNSCQSANNSMTQAGSAGMFEGKSIRLIKDSTTLSHGEMGTYVGNNGISYPTICIDTQEWMAKDLEETKYRDGTDIPLIGDSAEDNTTWTELTTGAYSVYPIP